MTARSLWFHSGVWRFAFRVSLVEASIYNEGLDNESKYEPGKLQLVYHSHREEMICIVIAYAPTSALIYQLLLYKEIHPMQSRIS
jgi:hypothetical protein